MSSRDPESKASNAHPIKDWRAILGRATPGVTYRQVAWALGAAALFGLIQLIPLMGATAQPGVWNSAVRSTAAGLQRPGYGAVSLSDRVAEIFWRMGAERGLAVWQGAQVFLIAAFFTLSALILAGWVGGLFPKAARYLMAGALVLLAAWSGWRMWDGLAHRSGLVAPVALSQPEELYDDLVAQKAGPVFASPTALGYLMLRDPEIAKGLSIEASASLVRNPRAWREALRASGWRAALLAGPGSEYRGLLDHLLTSPDWRLARVSNQGYLFLREAGAPAAPLDPDSVKLGSSRDTAVYLAQIAERYEAIRRTSEARQLSKLAVEAAPDDVEVLSHTAALEASRGKWYDAIVYCDRALQIDPDSTYLRLLKASCLLETKQPEKAEQLARQVLDRSPNDLYTLFLYARISRSLHDARAESETLEKLIKLTPSDVIPVNYFIFLGQAYARLGYADLALKSYRDALARPDIGPQLSAEVRDQIKTIEDKAGK